MRGQGRGDLAKGEVARGQYLFQDDVEYAGVRVSEFVVWTWSYSITNPGGPKFFVEDKPVGAMTLMFAPLPPCGR